MEKPVIFVSQITFWKNGSNGREWLHHRVRITFPYFVSRPGKTQSALYVCIWAARTDSDSIRLLRIYNHNRLLHLAQNKVHVSVISLLPIKIGETKLIEKLACKMPVNCLSPLSLTKTRSLRDKRMRSKGSWMPWLTASMRSFGLIHNLIAFETGTPSSNFSLTS